MTNEEFIKNISLKGEEWRDVVGYEGLYVVSSFGRVVSFVKQTILKPHDYFGYKKVTLYKNKSSKRLMVHRIVAFAFIPNANNSPCIDHIDTDRANNSVANLRWCSYKENSNNPLTIAKYQKRCGVNNPAFGKHLTESHRNKLSIAKSGKVYSDEERYNRYDPQKVVQLTLDGKFIKCWNSVADVAKFYGCQKNNIYKVIQGINKSAKGSKWVSLSDYESLINKSKNS